MDKLLAQIKLFWFLIVNKKMRKEFNDRKKMKVFYKKMKLGLWVLLLVDRKMKDLGFTKSQQKVMRRSYYKNGTLSSSFLKRMVTDTNILKEINDYEHRRDIQNTK